MPTGHSLAPLADVPDGQRRDGGPELVIRRKDAVIPMPVLARRRYEIGEPVEELKRREFDDAISSRPRGLLSTILPDPVERPFSREVQEIGFDLVESLNRLTGVEYPGDPATAARIASYELAFRMQRSVPEVMDFSGETEETKRLYGLDLPHCKDFATQLLASRRLVERGVRFIQIQHGGGGAGAWDAHGGLRNNHQKNALAVDQPIGGLLEDLDRRGLLDETLVVFCTEFGRTPGSQGSDGRDHHPFGFSIWLAGGGIRRGVVHGATDELGFHAVEDRHYVTDVHATILKLLGLDSRRLEVPGRKRLAIDHGTPIDAIIA